MELIKEGDHIVQRRLHYPRDAPHEERLIGYGTPAPPSGGEATLETITMTFPPFRLPVAPLLAAALGRCGLRTRAGRHRVLFILPVFLYNFGTMFLLTGAEDTMRFFTYTYLLTPVLLLFIFGSRREEERA